MEDRRDAIIHRAQKFIAELLEHSKWHRMRAAGYKVNKACERIWNKGDGINTTLMRSVLFASCSVFLSFVVAMGLDDAIMTA